MIKIYELRDPRDTYNQPRYVGYTSLSLHERMVDHLKPSHLVSKTHKNNWIKSLLSDNVLPVAFLIEEVDNLKLAWEREIYWISYYKKLGYNITNSTDGGIGTKGCKAREETKLKIAKNNTGRKMSEENKRKLYLANKGRKFSEEHRRKISEWHKGKPMHPHTKQRCREGTMKPLVVCFDNGEIREYESVKDCAKDLNYSLCTVSNILKEGRRKSHTFTISYKRNKPK